MNFSLELQKLRDDLTEVKSDARSALDVLRKDQSDLRSIIIALEERLKGVSMSMRFNKKRKLDLGEHDSRYQESTSSTLLRNGGEPNCILCENGTPCMVHKNDTRK